MSEDLIKRSDAIKDLCDICNHSDMPNDWPRGMSVAISALYRVPPVPPADRPQEWIPCSERLPEEREWIGTKKFGTTISDEVLVTFESRGERFVRPIHFQNGELGGMDKHTMDAVHGEW